MRLEERHCTLCGPDGAKKVRFDARFSEDDFNTTLFAARRSPDRKHFRIVECDRCGMVYSDPAAAADELWKLYQGSAVTYGRQEEQIYQSYAPVLDRALKWLPAAKRGHFVEVGGGRGFMLRYGAEHGFARQTEIEPSADAHAKFEPAGPEARFIEGPFVRGTLPAGSASLICFFQVLDHIPDPRGFLSDVYSALAPGGVAVCVTHDTSALSARLFGERSPIYDVQHTYLFSPANLPALFRSVGFAESESFAVANDYSIKYWMHLFPGFHSVKPAVLKVLESVGAADLRVRLRAGNFGVIARKGESQ